MIQNFINAIRDKARHLMQNRLEPGQQLLQILSIILSMHQAFSTA
jgi:hypothetical protein